MTDDIRASSPPAHKADPESLVLRAAPRPVVRFRRGLIIGITGAVAATLIALAWMALEPPSFRLVADEQPAGEPGQGGTPDMLADAPASYGEVPRLGPPLPGDLGRSILEHQRSLETEGPPASPDAAAAAEAERQRLEAARSSALLVQLGGGQAGAPDAPAEETVSSSALDPAAADAAPPVGATPTRVIAFGSAETSNVAPHRLVGPSSPWTLSAGTVIPASLITGLNSDLPGTVLAQVTENVRDSATGRTVLIPQGARLIGTYDNVVGFGQRRAMVVWQRILFPDGASVGLDNVPAADMAGYSGLEDEVDFHSWRLLTGIALSTLLGVGTELSLGDDESELVRALRESSQHNAARAGDRITSRNLDIQPSLTVRSGWPVRAVLHKDLVLRPWRREQ